MAYEVRIAPLARCQIKKLPHNVQQALVQAMTLLGDDPRPHGVEKMTGEGNEYRVREGDYRIVYTIRDAALIVLIIRIGHRKDIYR
jgi:mRNA interferase RelE/StbE